MATNFSTHRAHLDSTSGSTGNPLDFYVDNATKAIEVALAYRHLKWLDYQDGDTIAEIKEDCFVDPTGFIGISPVQSISNFLFSQ